MRPAAYDGLDPRAPRTRGAIASLLVLVALTFAGTLRGGFVYDDQFLVVENPHLADPADWIDFFRAGSWSGAGIDARNYRPLPLLTIALNHAAGGLEPIGYHAVNVLVHALSAVLLFAVARALGLGLLAAWWSAALFAVHPLQVEPVAEIVGRMDLLAGAALLGGLLAHLRLRRAQRAGEPGAAPAAAAILLYAAGLLSKEHVFLLPAIAATWDVLARPVPLRRALQVHAGYAGVASAYLLVRAAVFGGELLAGRVALLDNPLAHVDVATRVPSALAIAARYLLHVAWPARLSPDYCYAQILPFASPVAPGALAALAGTAGVAAVALLAARRSPRVAFAAALGVATFLPVSNLLFPIGTVMGDRLFYLPLAALALLLGIAIESATAVPSRVRTLVALAAVTALAIAAERQSRHWRDAASLDRLAVRNSPRCARAHGNLGYDHLAAGELGAARASFATALAIHPELPKAEVGLALVAVRGGAEPAELAGARRRAERALELDPRSTAALEVAAEIARRTGDLQGAVAYWERRLAADPNHAPTLSNLAIVDWEAGRPGRAIERWRRAAAQPDAPAETWLNLARALAAAGRADEAEEAMRRYGERRPLAGRR